MKKLKQNNIPTGTETKDNKVLGKVTRLELQSLSEQQAGDTSPRQPPSDAVTM